MEENMRGKGHRMIHYKEYEDIDDIREIMGKWENPPLNEMSKNIQDIWNNLQSHKLNLLTVNNRLARQETSLSKIENQLGDLLELCQNIANPKTNVFTLEGQEHIHTEKL